jgi:hypothetical protein
MAFMATSRHRGQPIVLSLPGGFLNKMAAKFHQALAKRDIAGLLGPQKSDIRSKRWAWKILACFRS